MQISAVLLLLLPAALAAPHPKQHSDESSASSWESPSSTASSSAPSSTSSDSDHSGSSSSGIDFSHWKLQLPDGEPGHPETIDSSILQSGYTNDKYFYTKGDVLVMKVSGGPDSGCVTTPNSKHCRTELRETDPSTWDPHGSPHRLRATLTVIEADNSKWGTVVGQIHIDDSVSKKPVCELFYNRSGDINMGVEETRDGDLKYTKVGHVPLGEEFTYEIRYENEKLSVSVNGETTELSQYELDSPASYFKAGNYNQGEEPSEVHFREIVVEH